MGQTASLSRYRRLLRKGQRDKPPVPSLEVIPFEPPRGGVVAENYLVSYEQRLRDSVTYRSSYTVYIYQSEGKGLYLVKEPYLNPELGATVAEAISSLSTWLAPSPVIQLDPLGYLFAELKRAGFMNSGLTEDDLKGASHYLMREILGYSTVDPLIRDPEIEDISCEGLGRPVKVWHRKFNANGWLESNISFPTSEKLDATVSRLVHRSNRSLSVSSPIVDCVLPEGYRLAATWGKEVTSLGSSFSIRKLRAIPYTISELIHSGMLDAKMAAHLWMLLEMRGFVVISGVTASGKTTLLNALGTVINPNWKVLSIEDTREITLPQSGWKPLHTKHTQADGSNVSLFDLVKLSLRERPDFVILGESRGEEVQVLFQAAASGSGCLTTFHAPNSEALQVRLTQPPLSVARTSLDLIDAVVFTVRDQKGRRYVHEVVEPGSDWVTVFRHAENGGEGWEGTPELSAKLAKRAEGFGYSAKRVSSELEARTKFLEGLVGKGITDYESLSKELRRFYLLSSSTLTL
ncbi:MAG: type II/IV secretion system ATPase subunit [Thaumarchaeota archaeon]|nr:type II/IV secretion system ATPase subunit [Nitrososphaerota archaeon]